MAAGAAFSVTITKSPSGDTSDVYLYMTSQYLIGTTALSFSGGPATATVSNLMILVSGTYSIYATCTGMNRASTVIQVTASASKALRFTTQPSNGNTAFTVVVTAKDIYGNSVTDTSSVTLSLAANTALFNPVSVSMVSGVATFNSVSVGGTGTFNFVATCSGMVSAVSNSFTASQVLSVVTVLTSTETVYQAVAASLIVKLQDSNSNTYFTAGTTVTISTATASVLAADYVLTTTDSDIAYVVPLTFNKAGTFAMQATCSPSCSTVSSPGVTVVKNAYVNIKWTGTINEGTSTTYQVGLLGKTPSSAVIVSISSSSSLVTLSTSSFTFNSVGAYQSVPLTVSFMGGTTHSVSVTLTHSATSSDTDYSTTVYSGSGVSSGGAMTIYIYSLIPSITVDSQVSLSSLSLGNYQVSFSVPPTNPVTVTPSFTGSAISISPSSHTFTSSDYSRKTFTITSLTSLTTNMLKVTITHSITTSDTIYSSATMYPPSLRLVATVIESVFAGVAFTNSYVNIAYGEAGTYTAKLKLAPTSAVTLTLTASPAYVTLSPSSFSLSDATTSQTITATVTTAVSSLKALNYQITITHALTSSDTNYNGLSYLTTINVINTCQIAVYDWSTSSTCSATITNYIASGSSVSPCAPGTYYSAGSCTSCTAGFNCPDGTNQVACPSGFYSSSTGQLTCTKSSAGLIYSSATAVPSTAASAGTYTMPGSSSATVCKAGDYCPSNSLNVEYKCPQGTYQSSTSSTSCLQCPSGKSCQADSASNCSPSTLYSPAGRPECYQCSAVFTACTSTTITVLTEGNMLSGSSSASCTSNKVCSIRNNFQATSCPIGTVFAATNTCKACNSIAGVKSCDGTSSSSTANCAITAAPWGVYCLTCPYPTYTSSSSCLTYSAGSDTAGTCSNYYWAPGGYRTCIFCSPGYKCTTAPRSSPTNTICTGANICAPNDSVGTATCPIGTINVGNGLMHMSQCSVCQPGYSCIASMSAYTNTYKCGSGKFCPFGTKSTDSFVCLGGSYSSASNTLSTNAECTVCTLSNYCQSGSSYSPGSGFFTADLLTNSACPFGYYYVVSGSSADNIADCLANPCTANGFCPRASSLPTLCPLGFTSTNSVTRGCERCGEGVVCSGSSLATSAACANGAFCPRATYLENQFNMISGYYIAVTNAVSEKDAVECPPGSFCPAAASVATGTCQAGFYCLIGSPLVNFFACPPGTFLTTTAGASLSDCAPCTPGSACMTASAALTSCSPGFFCPVNTERPDQFPCLAGTYSTSTSLTAPGECTDCAAGYYCPAASTKEYPCPEGTFRATTRAGGYNDCVPCTEKNYCGSPNTDNPTACNAGYYCKPGATAQLTCIATYYCDVASMSYTDMTAKVCPAGYLCGYGVNVLPSSTTTYDCPAGYYCLAGAKYVIPCRPGTFNANVRGTQLSSCATGTAGYYLDTYAAINTGTACPAGYYCLAGTTQPTPCPAGTYNPDLSKSAIADCLICPAGKYCPYEAMTIPTSCPQGSYCVAGVSTPTLCPVGTYGAAANLVNMAACTKCDAGKYCDSSGLTTPTGDCAAGYYCLLASITATPVGKSYGYLCPAGTYCPQGTALPQSCPAGTFNNYEGQSTSAGCISCPVGYYCSSAVLPEPSGKCAAGYFCGTKETSATPAAGAATLGHFAPGGTQYEIECPLGTYQDTTAQAVCKVCTAGNYCPSMAMPAPTICPEGFYCPEGCLDPIPCAPGTFRATTGATSAADCAACTAGKYCKGYGQLAVSGDCAAGFFCESGSPYESPSEAVIVTSTYGPCPKGYYCPVGTTSRSANPCAPGTYNPAELGTSSSNCLKCTAGRFCPGTANIADGNICPEQYFCPESTSVGTANPCTAGHYCAAGSDYEKPCPPGSYTDLAQQIICLDCPIGNFCPRTTSSLTSQTCPVGFYCPLKTFYNNQYACPPGTYSDVTGINNVGQCKDCPAGKYCSTYGIGDVTSLDCAAGFYCTLKALVNKPTSAPTGGVCGRGTFCPAGSSAPVSCTTGKYCDKSQLSAVSGDCTAGFYCTLSATIPSPSGGLFAFGDVCPQGSYCEAGSGSDTKCPPGKYMPYTGAVALSDCIDCPPGFYCPNTGTTDASKLACPAGYVCALGVSVGTTTACAAGYYCPLGSHEQIKCEAGTYQDLTAQSACVQCPVTKYCETGAAMLTDCPAGYYCPAGTGYRNSYPCPAGTYNPTTGKGALSDCLACTLGKYCNDVGLSAPSGDCNAGYYCTGSAVVASPSDGSSLGSVCTKGNFCAAGSSAMTACTAGYYCIKQGLGAVSGQCTAGYYCLAGSTTPVPTDGVKGAICPAGKYCAVGVGLGTNCAAASFGAGLGLTAASDCASCPFGYYCATAGLTTPTNVCAVGSYCPASSSSATASACTAGRYCPAGSFEEIKCAIGTYQPSTSQGSCLACTSGNYCPLGSSGGTPCIVGYSCPAGTRLSTEFPCAAGSYTSTTGQATCSQCVVGNECWAGSSTSGVACPQFSYCVAGTKRAKVCLAGTYNIASTGLNAASNCLNCPAGRYCVDGRNSADCEAGYICTGGSPTPTPIGTNSYGGECPINNYCPQGTLTPVACPVGKFNTLKGGKSSDDCTDCPPGYYCTSTTPVACPAGFYCPQGVQTPTACPIRTYNPLTQQDSPNSCLICPGGYMCTGTGVSDYSKYKCNTIGAYCVVGAQKATPCPPGTYSNSTTAASLQDCIVCKEGYHCPGGSNITLPCDEGEYCPRGSAYPKRCLVGYYCPPMSGISLLCPKGFFCPKYAITKPASYVQYSGLYYNTTHLNSSYYLPCPAGYVCPDGSFAPEFCQPGYAAVNNLCVACKTGNYSNSVEGCKRCDPGYICVKGAIRPDPVQLSTQGGYICPAGYYCPAGAAKEIPCPPGSYNPTEGKASSDVCVACPADTYTDTYGNARCLPCGSSASSVSGSTTCNCTGSYRSYLKSDGTCRCVPGYQFVSQEVYVSDQDGVTDCFPIVFPFCDKGLERDPSGKCVQTDDCSSQCGEAGGKVLNGVGVCQCNNIPSTDALCDPSCRKNSPKFTMKDNMIIDSLTGESSSVGSTAGYYGYTKCSEGCDVHAVDMNDEGPTALYGYSAGLNGIFKNRRSLATSSTGVKDPVICVSINGTFVFSVSADHYPVYKKDSLLNTNANFDFGPFAQLETLMKSPNSEITIFAYTFQEQGIYDFVDSSNSAQRILISVMGAGQQCPDPDIPYRTRMASTMLTLGTQSQKNIITDPDWLFIGTTVLWMVVIMIFIILGVYFFENVDWKYSYRLKSDYRAKQVGIDVEKLTRPENSSSSFEESSSKDGEKKNNEEIGMEDLMGNDDVDPMIFQHMLKLLQDQDALAKATFAQRTEDGAENISNMLERLNKLKQFLRDSLAGLNDHSEGEESEHEIEVSADQEIEKALGGIADNFVRDTSRFDDAKKKLQEMLNDPNLSEKDKRDLLQDFNANMERIDQALILEQHKAQQLLNKRLLDRKTKRKQKDSENKGREPEEREEVEELIQPAQKMGEKEIQAMEEERKVIRTQIDEEKDQAIKKMREELSSNLKVAKDKREKDELMEAFNKKVKDIELRSKETRERQEADMMQRLQNRKGRNKKSIKSLEIETDLPVEIPNFFKEEDQEKILILGEKHEEARQKLYEQQEQERIAVLGEIDRDSFLGPSKEDRQRLEAAMKATHNDNERKELLRQLSLADRQIASSATAQQNQMEAKLLERKRLRAIREAELKKKHLAEQAKLDDQEDKEVAALTNDITKERIEDLLNSHLSPEEITKQIKEMIDEKHKLELSQIMGKKQEMLAERQTYLLQELLTVKATDMQKVRRDYANKRNEVETSAMHPSNKLLELQSLEKKEADAVNEIDYNFINKLAQEQDALWRGVEEEFRQRFLELADKHLEETSEILQKMRQVNPELLDSHLRQAKEEALDLRKQVENDYKEKCKELDSRQREFSTMQGEREREIEDLKRQLDEAEAKKKELFEVDKMRKEMEDKQKKMIEEMRRRGIKPEQMEEMIKKHQQEMSEWEAAMERERIRQKEKMQERLNARLAKYQEQMAQRIAKNKEENQRITLAKEEEKLAIKFVSGRKEMLFEPIKDIDTKLRVNPLPVFVRNTVAEYADYSNLLQTLLMRVKRIERTVASVDLDQFEAIMSQLENISGFINQLKKK